VQELKLKEKNMAWIPTGSIQKFIIKDGIQAFICKWCGEDKENKEIRGKYQEKGLHLIVKIRCNISLPVS
jgi:hypothetical protein